MRSSAELGKRGEDIAVDHLTLLGVAIMTRNYRSRHGEIDIIGAADGYITFYEVKTRSNNTRSFPIESAITRAKLRRMMLTATHYMMVEYGAYRNCRFVGINVTFDRNSIHTVDMIDLK